MPRLGSQGLNGGHGGVEEENERYDVTGSPRRGIDNPNAAVAPRSCCGIFSPWGKFFVRRRMRGLRASELFFLGPGGMSAQVNRPRCACMRTGAHARPSHAPFFVFFPSETCAILQPMRSMFTLKQSGIAAHCHSRLCLAAVASIRYRCFHFTTPCSE